MEIVTEPTASETIKNTQNLDTWNMERTEDQLRSFISNRLSAAALQDVSL